MIPRTTDGAIDQSTRHPLAVIHQGDRRLAVHGVTLAEEDGHGHPQTGDTAGDPEPVEVIGAADELKLGQTIVQTYMALSSGKRCTST
mgnify:CR=1 FL=1